MGHAPRGGIAAPVCDNLSPTCAYDQRTSSGTARTSGWHVDHAIRRRRATPLYGTVCGAHTRTVRRRSQPCSGTAGHHYAIV
eukprot:scaffold1874_cov109-Isochrysis_galbana.AAC.7